MFKVKEDSLIQLEKDLNKVEFRGIPIGGILASSLYIELLMGRADWSIKARIKDIFLRFNLLNNSNRSVFKKKQDSINWSDFQGQALLTFSSSRKHVFDINYRIWKILNKKDTICLLNDFSIVSNFDVSDNPNMFFLSNFPFILFGRWKQSFSEVSKEYYQIVQSFVLDNGLPRFIARRIYNNLISQTQILMAYEQFLTKVNPRFIVVEYDRFFNTSPLVLAAKALHIPSFTMMHGAVNNRFGYLPILADRLFCWGEGQKKLLERFGNEFNIGSDLIQIAGAPQLMQKVIADKKEQMIKLEIPFEKKVVLLATNNVRLELRHKLVEIFCEAIASNDAYHGIVRFHPSEDSSFYKVYQKQYPTVTFDMESILSYEESLSIADLVCIYNSAFGLDAVLRNIPVLIINIETEGLGQAEDLISSGEMPCLNSLKEFEDILNRYRNDQTFRLELNLKVQKHALYYCAFFGDAAARQTVKLVNKYIDSLEN